MSPKNNPSAGEPQKIKFHCDGDIGYGQRRTRLEDRYVAKSLTTAGGLELVVGIIADGVGGGNAGELASQMTVDKVVAFIGNTQETDIEQVLNEAILTAHEAVREAGLQNPKLRSMSTTVTVAVIMNNRLFIGHVGDSRAYLVRENQLQLLTLDHSWANEMIQQGKFSPEEVKNHPKRGDLGRYIGQPKQIPLEVDLGYRVFKDDQPDAKSDLVAGGLELQPGDVVILCSDGLIKERHNAPGHFVEEQEIVDAVRRKRNSPEDIVNTLLSRALGRQTDDNVSVVALLVPGGAGSAFPVLPLRSGLPKWVMPLAVVSVAVIVFLILLMIIFGQNAKTVAGESTATHATMVQVLPDQNGVGFAEVLSGLAEYQISGEKSVAVNGGEEIPAGAKIWTDYDKVELRLSDGSIVYLGEYSSGTLITVCDPDNHTFETIYQIEKGTVLINAICPIRIQANPHTSQANADPQTWLGVEYRSDDGYFSLDCLDGRCQLIDNTNISLTSGQRGVVEKGMVNSDWVSAEYASWIVVGGQFVPTPTITPSPTATYTVTPTDVPTEAPVILQPIDPVETPKPEKDKDKEPEKPTEAPPEEPPPGGEG